MATSFFSTLSIDCISYARQSQFLRINRTPIETENRAIDMHFHETGLICFYLNCHICHTFLAAHNDWLYHKCNKKSFLTKLMLNLCLMILVFIYFDLWSNLDFLT